MSKLLLFAFFAVAAGQVIGSDRYPTPSPDQDIDISADQSTKVFNDSGSLSSADSQSSIVQDFAVTGDTVHYEFSAATAYAGPADICVLTQGGQNRSGGFSISWVPKACRNLMGHEAYMNAAQSIAIACRGTGCAEKIDHLMDMALYHLSEYSRKLGWDPGDEDE